MTNNQKEFVMLQLSDFAMDLQSIYDRVVDLKHKEYTREIVNELVDIQLSISEAMDTITNQEAVIEDIIY